MQEDMFARGTDNPLLNKVRECSAEPDLAVDFFSRIFSPCPTCRLGTEALYHPYLASTTAQMIADLPRFSKHLSHPVPTMSTS